MTTKEKNAIGLNELVRNSRKNRNSRNNKPAEKPKAEVPVEISANEPQVEETKNKETVADQSVTETTKTEEIGAPIEQPKPEAGAIKKDSNKTRFGSLGEAFNQLKVKKKEKIHFNELNKLADNIYVNWGGKSNEVTSSWCLNYFMQSMIAVGEAKKASKQEFEIVA